MKGIINRFIEKTPENINVVGVLATIYIVISRLWKLNKGLIFSDEGWYYTLLKDNPTQDLSTRFFKLFQFGIQDDIYCMRLLLLLLLLGALFFFGYSLYKLQRSFGLKNSLFNCLAVVALGSLQAHSISTPNYINLNLLFGLLAVSFCFIYLSSQKWHYNVLSAFFACFLFTTQVLGVVLLLAMYLTVLIINKNLWRTTWTYVCGVVLFFCVFFGFVESPIDMMNSVTAHTQKVVSRGSGDYGLVFLIKWSFLAVSFIVKFLIAAFLFIKGVEYVQKNVINTKCKYLVYGLMFVAIMGYVNVFILPHCHASSYKKLNQLGLPLFIAFLLIVKNCRRIPKNSFIVMSLLLFTIYALCLGTNTEFMARYSTYLVFLLPVIFVFAQPSEKQKNIALLYFFIILLLSVVNVNHSNWLDERPSDQNVPVKSLGIDQNLYLTEGNIKQLIFCQHNIKEGTLCFSSTKTWGIVGLLNLKPASYSWKLPEAKELSALLQKKLKESDVVVISSIKEAFNHDELILSDNVNHESLTEGDVILDFYSLQ